jgi:hypothetical protein
VQQVRAELVPRLVDVVGDENSGRRVLGGQLKKAGVVAVCPTFVVV